MASNETTSTETSGQRQTRAGGILNHMMTNKIEAFLWFTRIFTIVYTILFLVPLFGGTAYSYYQRALISNAATSALRLHQRLPNFQISRQYFALLFLEDSCHYLLFSLIFINAYPITMSLAPVFLFSLLHACSYTKILLNIMGPSSLQFVHNTINKLEAQQVNILRFVACNEIFLMPAIIFMIFSGKASIFLPIIYHRFLVLRYSSRRNPYCRTLFSEMKMTLEVLCSKPQCPVFVRNVCRQCIALISRLAPQIPSN